MSNIQEFIFVHIGKCGGATVNKFCKINNIKHEVVHIRQCKFDSNKKYLILLRNPIKRFISAFNWRYKLVVDDKIQSNRFPGEKETLEKYKTVNNLAENICMFDVNKTYIHHIKEDINYYIEDFLKKCKKENILYVMTTETLDQDLFDLFNIHNNLREHVHVNLNYDKNLSQAAYENLKKYLVKDYQCISKLYELGVLSNDKYNFLSI
jgi:hypothetical protein